MKCRGSRLCRASKRTSVKSKACETQAKPFETQRNRGSKGVLELNDISGRIISCALKVHTAIGPGVLESVYQTCLLHELQKAGLAVQAQVALPVEYDGLRLDSGYRLDLLVENTVIIELKCVEALLPIHTASVTHIPAPGKQASWIIAEL